MQKEIIQYYKNIDFKKNINWILLSLFLCGLDQIIKHLLIYFNFPISFNQGIAFSIPIPFILILLINIITFFFLFTFLFQNKNPLTKEENDKIWPSLVLAGALSNLIDRVFLGFVIDYIDLHYWPVFNLADTYITIGVFLLIYKTTFKPKKDNQD